MKVLFLQDHLRENGGLRVVHDLAGRLQNDLVQATMFVLQSKSDPPVLTPSPDVPVVFGVHRRLALRWAIPAGAWRMVREARHHDILVSGSEVGYTFLLGWLVAKLVARPYVVLVQSPFEDAITSWVPEPLQAPTKWIIGRVDAAICVSEGLITGVTEAGLGRDKVFVVTVGLDVERARALAAGPANIPTPAAPYILAVGRLFDQKGFDMLIRAHASVQQHELPAYSVVILGEGPDRALLEGLAQQTGVKDSVMMPGFVDNPHPMLANADVFVLSSRKEGMGGLVLLEALAHGTPIIATDCQTGPRELLDGGRLGELVPTEDSDALADAILRYWRDPTELRRRAEDGPLRARDFDPTEAARQFTKVLVGVTAARRTRRGWFSSSARHHPK